MRPNHFSNIRRTLFSKWLPTAVGILALLGPRAIARAQEDGEGESEHSHEVVIRTLSSRPYLVSGGDTLVQIDLSRGIAARDVRVTLNGQDVTAAFRASPDGRALTGLVTGLRQGRNLLQALGRQRHRLASLNITNHPITGPIVSGPHLQPYICQTATFALPDGTTLGPPLDADCSAATRIHYIYQSTEGGALRPMPNPSVLPPDVAMTTTLDGTTVPFVVRVETGTMNRGIYQNAILHDPTSEPAPTPFSPPSGWNRRLIAMHGSGCPGGWYIQGRAGGEHPRSGPARRGLCAVHQLAQSPD